MYELVTVNDAYSDGRHVRLLNVYAEPTDERIMLSTTVCSNPVNYWQRFEFKNIDELIYIKQATGCVVVATVIKIQTGYGWFYHACTKCSKDIRKNGKVAI